MCPLLIDCLEHVGFRNLLQGGAGRLPCPADRHPASRRCSFAPARSGLAHEDQFPVSGTSARYGFRKETISGTRGNDEDAPEADLRLISFRLPHSTHSRRS
jgi:hypothetical protein